MAVHRVSHLSYRGGIYYFRIAVPARLRACLGRQELKVSLKTREPAVAKIRCRRLSNACEQLFNLAATMPQLTREKINDLIRKYFEEQLSFGEEIAVLTPDDPKVDIAAEIESLKISLQETRKQIARRRYTEAVRFDASDLLEEVSAGSLPHSSEEFDQLCNGILRARAEHLRILIAKLRGRYDQTAPADPLFEGAVLRGLPPIPGEEPRQGGDTLEKLIETYCEYKRKNYWVPKTYADNLRCLGWFRELVGGSKPVAYLSVEDVRTYRDALTRMPANLAKSKKYEGQSLAEILTENHDDQVLSVITAKKYFDNLRSFLNWCVAEGYIDHSPVGGIKIAAVKKAQEARHPFSPAQLEAIFESPQFTGHQSKTVRSKPGAMLVRDGKYWVPLIGLFSGMRLGEIVQLKVADVKRKNGLWYYDVSLGQGEEKHLKTASSVRIIPVHPELLKLGFPSYVTSRKAEDPDGRLFPDITRGKDGYYSHNFSKYFSRYLRQIGAKTERTSFHSFRHNFKDALVEAGVSDSVIKALLGHADTSVTAAYGSKFSIKVLYDAITKVDFNIQLIS